MLRQVKGAERTAKRAPGFERSPNYRFDLRPSSSLHQVIFNEAVIAASSNVIIVREQNLCAVVYFPRADVDLAMLAPEKATSYCPFKGEANYWSLEANGKSCASAAWSYEDPFDEAAPLRGHVAFYMDKMDCHWCNGMELPLLGPGRCQGEDCDEQRAA